MKLARESDAELEQANDVERERTELWEVRSLFSAAGTCGQGWPWATRGPWGTLLGERGDPAPRQDAALLEIRGGRGLRGFLRGRGASA